MARRIVWTEAALADLEETAEYIGRDSSRYAAAVVREVRDAARSLSRFATRGRMVPEFVRPDVRELIVRNYRLIYHVGPNVVSIIGFIHGSRDLTLLWRPEDRDPDGL